MDPACGHPMVPGSESCHCDLCGYECRGRFAGCKGVWQRGPQEIGPWIPSEPGLLPVTGDTLVAVRARRNGASKPALSPDSQDAPDQEDFSGASANGVGHSDSRAARSRSDANPPGDGLVAVAAAIEDLTKLVEELSRRLDDRAHHVADSAPASSAAASGTLSRRSGVDAGLADVNGTTSPESPIRQLVIERLRSRASRVQN